MKLNFLILLKERLKLIIVMSKIGCHVRFGIVTITLIIKRIIYQNIVISIVVVAAMENILNIRRSINLNGIMELLIQTNVTSARMMLENDLLTYMLVNRRLMDRDLNFPQIQR